MGNTQAAAVVKANAVQRANDLRTSIDDLRTQGVTSVRAIAAELSTKGILTLGFARMRAVDAGLSPRLGHPREILQ
jgi:hypothetical protein